MKYLLPLFLSMLLINQIVNAQSGSTCSGAYGLASSGCQTILLKDSGQNWFWFRANSSLPRLNVGFIKPEQQAGPLLWPYVNNPYVLSVIGGSCSSPTTVISDTATLKPGFHEDISSLTNGSVYYIRIDKPDSVDTWIQICFLPPVASNHPQPSCELVCNGDFEDSTGCIYIIGQMELTECWDKMWDSTLVPVQVMELCSLLENGTPDYFNANYGTCTPDPNPVTVGVPNNFMNNAQVFSYPAGNAYAGIFTYRDRFYPNTPPNWYTTVDFREYLQQQLPFPMQPGRTYSVSFYERLSDKSAYATKLGILFSNDTIGQLSAPIVYTYQTPQYVTPNYLTNSTAWQQVQFNFTVPSNSPGYSWISLGNYYDDDSIQSVSGNLFVIPPYSSSSGTYPADSSYMAYYFIDHVSIKPADTLDVAPDTTFCGVVPPYTLYANFNGTFGDSILWVSSPLDSSLIGFENDSIVTVTPQVSTNYYVTVWDIYGCVYQDTIMVMVCDTPAVPVIVPTSTTLCSGNTITYTIANYDPSLTYAVTVTPSTGVTILSPLTNTWVIVFPPPACTDYKVKFSVRSCTSTCVNSDSIMAYACCPCTFPLPDTVVVFGTPNNPYLSSNLPLLYYSNNVYNNPTGVLYINGYFLVDSNLTIDASKVLLGGGARIDVDSSMTLTIDNGSWLSAGCNYMWDGIYVDSPYETVVVKNSSIIEDAEKAIVADSGGVYTISSGSRFNKNYKGIVVKNYTSQNYPGTVQDSYFTCYAAYNVPTPSKALIAPYSGMRSYIGIEVSDIDSITIGNSLSGPNLFDYMDVGIGTIRTHSNIFNNDFVNITATSPQLSTVIAGRAIWVVGDYSFPQSGTWSVIVGVANDANSACTFRKCGVGIFAEELTDVFIHSNIFDTITNTGIFITHLDEPNVVQITDWNQMTYMPKGIWCRNNPLTRILIDNNSVILTGQPDHLGYGIIVEDLFPQKSPVKTTKVTKNFMYTVRRGIYILNQWDSTIVEGNYIVCNNTSTGNFTEGIEFTNVNNGAITANDVGSSGGVEWWMNGVRVNGGSANAITCNNLNSLGRGLFFDMPQTPKTTVARNIITNGESGILLNGNAKIGPQGYTFSPYDNEWSGSFINHTLAWSSNGPSSPFLVRPNPTLTDCSFTYFPCGSNMINLGVNGGFAIPFDTTSNINPINGCPLYEITEPSGDLTKQCLDIIFDSITYIICEESGKWEDEYSLYKAFLSDTALLNSNQYFIDFKDSVDVSNMGILHRITSIATLLPDAMGSYQDAMDSLENFLPDTPNNIEQLFITVDSILLSSMINSTALSQWDLDTLRSIAALCPPCDGPAVFLARSILSEYDSIPFNYLNECEQVPQQGGGLRLMKKADESTANFTVFPNPTNGEIQVSYVLERSGELTIYDVAGKLVRRITLSQGSQTLSLDLTNLESGVYNYQVTSDNEVVKRNKLVLVK